MDNLLTEREVAALWKISTRSLQSWRLSGENGPPYIKIGGSVRYSEEQLSLFLADRQRSSTFDPGRADR